MKKFSLIFPILFSLGCSGSDDEASHENEHEEVTYYQSIAPLYADKCVSCHQDGGIGPMALDNFEDAKKFARASMAATSSRQMPPYLVTADGSCGEFIDSRALSDAEIHLIADWVDQDTPAGEVTELPPAKDLPSLEGDSVSLLTPEFVPEIVGDEYSTFDEYRCFLVDPKIDEDTFLTGYDVTPGNAAIVHHVLAFPVDLTAEGDTGDGATNGEVIAALDGESPERDGWPCFGMAGDGVAVDGIPVTWAPGMGAVRYPHGAGVELPAGSQVVIQVHYNLSSEKLRGQSDSTTVKLSTSQNIERVGFFDLPDDLLGTLFDEEPTVIPPGEKNFEFSFEFDYDEFIAQIGTLDISGVFPHMHERGRTLRFEVIRGNETMCGGEVEHWDFNWQLFYFYQEPLELHEGDRLRVTCGYNTEGLDEPVLPGWGTRNEMCLAGLMLTVPLSTF